MPSNGTPRTIIGAGEQKKSVMIKRLFINYRGNLLGLI
jgi:hypothetical protein